MDTLLSNMDTVLSNDLMQAFSKRVGTYDRENRFFKEDFEDLRKAGYLTMNIPKEFGGQGLSLAEVCKRQRRLAYHAPATALGINMHVYWVGVAADLWRSGDKSLEWILKEAAAGEVFAAGHAERGNDIPLLLSTAKAERVAGGFKLTGHKMFGSLAPVWTRYGVHALWADAEGGPKVVHAFMPRSTRTTALSRPGTRSACAEPAATTWSSRALLFLTSTSRGSCRQEARTPSSWPSSPGRSWASPMSTTAWRSAPSIWPSSG